MFHVRDNVAGLVMWGTPTPVDLEPLLDVFRGFDSPLGRRLPRYFDVRRLESAEQPVLAQLLEFVKAHHQRLAQMFTSIASVHHHGVGQAIAEGVRALAGMNFQWGSFSEPLPALEWLKCPRAAQVAAHVDELAAHAAGSSLLVHDVRAWCAMNCTGRIEAAARALSLSPRTLQRRLSVLGTSFQALLDDVRLNRARELLSSTERSIAEIAHEVGYEARPFAVHFRRATGLSPSEWRAKRGAP